MLNSRLGHRTNKISRKILSNNQGWNNKLEVFPGKMMTQWLNIRQPSPVAVNRHKGNSLLSRTSTRSTMSSCLRSKGLNRNWQGCKKRRKKMRKNRLILRLTQLWLEKSLSQGNGRLWLDLIITIKITKPKCRCWNKRKLKRKNNCLRNYSSQR